MVQALAALFFLLLSGIAIGVIAAMVMGEWDLIVGALGVGKRTSRVAGRAVVTRRRETRQIVRPTVRSAPALRAAA